VEREGDDSTCSAPHWPLVTEVTMKQRIIDSLQKEEEELPLPLQALPRRASVFDRSDLKRCGERVHLDMEYRPRR
jgi:hypothetical protein